MFKIEGDKAVIQKGFMVECESWENDGDFYNTKTKTYLTLKDAQAVVSVVRSYEGLHGNDYNGRDAGDRSPEYDKEALSHFLFHVCDVSQEEGDTMIAAWEKKQADEEELTDDDEGMVAELDSWVADSVYDLVGGSEYYTCRVIDHIAIMEIPETVTIRVISNQYSARRD